LLDMILVQLTAKALVEVAAAYEQVAAW